MSRTTILVLGEDRASRLDVRRVLLAHGYPVRVASSMAEAAKAVAAGDVRLILLTERLSAERLRTMRDMFALPVVQLEPDGAHSVLDIVRTAAGAHDTSLDQDVASE